MNNEFGRSGAVIYFYLSTPVLLCHRLNYFIIRFLEFIVVLNTITESRFFFIDTRTSVLLQSSHVYLAQYPVRDRLASHIRPS